MLEANKDIYLKLIYVNLHKQYSLRVKMANCEAYRNLIAIPHLPNLTKQKIDKVNLIQVLSNEVANVLSLAKPPTHYFSGQGVPLHSLDDILSESRLGAIFC